jgi:3D (Asp-Asp-Asp) domain-containing protein
MYTNIVDKRLQPLTKDHHIRATLREPDSVINQLGNQKQLDNDDNRNSDNTPQLTIAANRLIIPDRPKIATGDVTSSDKPMLDITATAYAPGVQDNDQWNNKTYMGTQIRPGVIAVDPKVIPLGSRVYVQYPDGHGDYAVAEDTGGAIKGNRIDIAMRSHDQANHFGIQNVKVYVVKKPNDSSK